MTITADEILGMTRSDFEQAVGSGQSWTALIKEWHPDVCSHPQAATVMGHLMRLKKGAQNSADAGPLGRILRTTDGRRLKLSPFSAVGADQGEIIVNRNTLATIFSPDMRILAEREIQIIESFAFADKQMRAQMSLALPRLLKVEELDGGATIVIIRKSQDEVLLSDLLNAEGCLPDVHAAWLCSGLMNIAAWLEYAGLVHGAISAQHILVDPVSHSVRLAAGWAFATKVETRPTALPGSTLTLLPQLAAKGQHTETRFDRELVRQTLRQALGDPAGTNGRVAALPTPLKTWLILPAPSSAFDDYGQWQAALEDGWGKRRFVKYPVKAAQIYPAL